MHLFEKGQQQRAFAFRFFLQLPILKEAGLDKIQKQKFVCKKLAQKTNYQAKDKKQSKNAVNTLQLRQH